MQGMSGNLGGESHKVALAARQWMEGVLEWVEPPHRQEIHGGGLFCTFADEFVYLSPPTADDTFSPFSSLAEYYVSRFISRRSKISIVAHLRRQASISSLCFARRMEFVTLAARRRATLFLAHCRSPSNLFVFLFLACWINLVSLSLAHRVKCFRVFPSPADVFFLAISYPRNQHFIALSCLLDSGILRRLLPQPLQIIYPGLSYAAPSTTLPRIAAPSTPPVACLWVRKMI